MNQDEDDDPYSIQLLPTSHNDNSNFKDNGKHGKLHKPSVKITKSLPANPRKTSINYPIGLTRSSTSRAKLPYQNSIDASTGCVVIDNNADVELHGLESATSSSLLHGIILGFVMIFSLSAFVCSKLDDPCEDYYLFENMSCSKMVGIYFSIINLSSCLYSLIIYFLHLIGQCDYISWSARRKVELEILLTLIIIILCIISIILILLKTMAIYRIVTLTSAILSFLACILYVIRVIMLARETRMLYNKPKIENNEDLPGISGSIKFVNNRQIGSQENEKKISNGSILHCKSSEVFKEIDLDSDP